MCQKPCIRLLLFTYLLQTRKWNDQVLADVITWLTVKSLNSKGHN